MKINAKNEDFLNFSSFNEQLWIPGQKKGFGYKTKYPRMRSDKKFILLKMKISAKNSEIWNFSLFCGQLWFPGQK